MNESIDSKINRLATQSLDADEIAERETTLARQLSAHFHRERLSLSPSEFGAQQSRLQQQQLKADEANRIAHERRAALDTVRDAEAARLRRETLQREYRHKSDELQQCHLSLLEQRRQAEQLREALQVCGLRHGQLLRELSELKLRLAMSV